jgi:hypothetical protein
MVLWPVLPGYGRTPAQERVKSENSAPASLLHQAALQGIASTVALQGSTGKTEVAKTKQEMPKDVVILRGSPLGAVKFDHKLHSLARNTKCETCHHPSRKEKPAATATGLLGLPHKVAIAPMKPASGRVSQCHGCATCINCHKAENAKGS